MSVVRAGETLRIAAVATIGSPHQPDGVDVISAARQASLSLSRQARSVHLLERQEDCTAERADAVARELVALPHEERPHAVVGHLCSSAAIAAARTYGEAGILLITTGARHPRLTLARTAPHVFRLASSEARLASDLAGLIIGRFAGHRVAFAHERSLQARAIVDDLEARLRTHGVGAVLRESYVHGERSYAALAERLIAAGVQLLVIPTQPIEAGVILRNLTDRGQRMTVILGDIAAAFSPDLAIGIGHQQVIVMLPWLERPRAISPANSRSADESNPSPTWLRTHAAIEVLAHAVSLVGARDREAIVRALETESASTVAGPIRFDTRGDAIIPSYVPWEWRGSAWHPLGY